MGGMVASTNKLRILQVSMHRGTGGAESVAALLTATWQKLGHEVVDLFISDGSSNVQAAREKLPTWKRLARVARAVRAHKPDVIISHSTIPSIYSRLGWLIAGAPKLHGRPVSVYHSASCDYTNRLLLFAEYAVSAAAPAKWLAVSEESVQYLRQRSFRGAKQARHVTNPIADKFYTIKRDPEPFSIIMLGRVVEQKDYARALEIVAQPSIRELGATLRIFGSQDDRAYFQSLRKLTHDLGLSDADVLFLEPISAVEDELALASVFLHTAKREAASVVLREVYAAGIPIVVTPDALRGVPDVTTPWVLNGTTQQCSEVLRSALLHANDACAPPIDRTAIRDSLRPRTVALNYLEFALDNKR